MLKWEPFDAEKAWVLLESLVLDTGETWGDVMAPWTRTALAAVLRLPMPGQKEPPTELDMVWVCGPVGCGKDQIIAAASLALLVVYPDAIRGIMQSSDRDKSEDVVQYARGFKARDEDDTFINVEILEGALRSVCNGCGKHDCTGKTGTKRQSPCHGSKRSIIVCESLDGPSHSGSIYDIAVMNELQEWPSPEGQKVYANLFARSTKRHGQVAVFSNAPFSQKGDWRRDLWETARGKDSDWFYIQPTVDACPWITPASLEKKRRNLPTAVFRRLFLCEVGDGRGELVTREEVERCIVAGLAAADAPTAPGRRFLGLDAGVMRDHYTMCVVRLDPAGAIVLEALETRVPEPGKPVDLEEARDRALVYGVKWKCEAFLDPFQARDVEQALVRAGCKAQCVDFTAVNLTEMTSAVMRSIRDCRVRLYLRAGFVQVDETTQTDLVRQLLDAEVREQERGYRIVHQRTRAGHGDQLTAFALAMLGATRAAFVRDAFCIGSAARNDAAPPDRGSRRDIHRLVEAHTGRYFGARATHTRRLTRC